MQNNIARISSTMLSITIVSTLLSGNAVIAQSAPGPLVVHPDNGRYFMVQGDRRKRAIYLTGSHVWCNLQRYHSDNSDFNIDFDEFLSTLEKHQHNFIRGWHWEDMHYHPLPFARTGPGEARDGQPKFDLSRYNQAYYDHLRGRIVAAGKRGIYVSVMLFQGWSIDNKGGGRTPNPWPLHPFNESNNINGIDGDSNGDGISLELHTLKSDGFGIAPEVTALQAAYVKHSIDQLNDLDNLVWEITNESHDGSINWQYHIIQLIHDYEKTKPRQHLVWMNFYSREVSNACLFEGPADVVSPHNSKTNYREPPPAKGDKIVILDTDHLWGVGGNPAWVWKAFTRGYHPIFMDPLHNIEWYRRKWRARDPRWIAIRTAMGHARNYARRMDLSTAKPLPALSSTRYCLANPGKEYLVFQPQPGQFWVRLEAGRYSYEWFNPYAGSVTATATSKTPGGDEPFTPPFGGSAILYLKRDRD